MRKALLLMLILTLAGCATTAIEHKDGHATQRTFALGNLVKGDGDMVAEVAQREVLRGARQLMEKLYRRNPAEFRKIGEVSAETATARLFGELDRWEQSPLRQMNWEVEWRNAFRDDFAGDRVYAFMSALTVMIMASYENKQQLFLTDQLDPQKLYNSARNIEVAVWKLNAARQPSGAPYFLANSLDPGQVNLSFEREFGKLIAQQDLLALVLEDSGNRTVTRVIQNVASFVFLPI